MTAKKKRIKVLEIIQAARRNGFVWKRGGWIEVIARYGRKPKINAACVLQQIALNEGLDNSDLVRALNNLEKHHLGVTPIGLKIMAANDRNASIKSYKGMVQFAEQLLKPHADKEILVAPRDWSRIYDVEGSRKQ